MANYRILIVDDDAKAHQVLGDYLKLSGYDVLRAGNGREGLELMDARKPDLVLLDIQMPVMDGFQMLTRIRLSPDFRRIPVILLSSLDRRFLKEKGRELGADDFLVKPFSGGELIRRLNLALRQSERRTDGDGMMKGELSDLSLSDLLQSMELGEKTAGIHLDAMDGEIHIRKGALIHARQGNFLGKDALSRIFLLEKGAFRVKFNEIPPADEAPSQPLISVLLQVSANADELRETLERMGGERRHLNVSGDISKVAALKSLRSLFPMSVRDLIVRMEGDLEENAETVQAAVDAGVLSPV